MTQPNLKPFSPIWLTTDQKIELVMKDLEEIKSRLRVLEDRVNKIPDPFVIYYKEPGKEEYSKLNEALDTLFLEIEKLKDGNSKPHN